MHGAPRTLGPYRLVRELARGGMGAVHEGVHEVTGARHAVKTLLPAGLGGADEVELRRFRREVEVLGQLEHPHVVRVHAAALDGPTPWLAQDLLPGGSLQRRLEAEGPLPVEQAVAIARDLALALEHAHARGVLHRDLKPHNVLFDDQGAARLVDFGLTRRVDAGSRLTATGALLGTPAFMAPEQALAAASADARSDVYGLGATLWAMLVGRPPFEGASLWAVLEQVAAGRVPTPSRHRRGVPPWLDAVVLKAMARDPAARFATAAELASALERGGPGRGRWPLVVGAALAALAAFAAVGAALAAAEPPAGGAVPTATSLAADERASDGARTSAPGSGGAAAGEATAPSASYVARDGSTMLWIPGAAVAFEVRQERGGGRVRREVAVGGFYLARDEVTWAQLRSFRRDSGYAPGVEAALSERPCPQDEPAHPVRLEEAQAYCDFYAGLRLPAEAEWVLAAFGSDDRPWPWGADEPTPERASLCYRDAACDDLAHHPRPIGRPLGASPFGCRDMIGNVSEWLRGEDEHGEPIRRGGDAGAHPELRARLERRTGRGVERGQGFRVAASRAAPAPR